MSVNLDDVLAVIHRVAETSAGDPEASRAVLGELAESLQRQGDKDERFIRGEAVDADVEDAGRAALELFCYWPEPVSLPVSHQCFLCPTPHEAW